MDDLINLIRREIGRWFATYAKPRVGTVSSWDPDNHLAKVLLKPIDGEDGKPVETGWMPVAVDHVGDGYGDLMALQIGDQVDIDFQEHDPESPRIRGRVHSDDQKPPRLEAGEMLRKHKDGAELRQDKDGNIWLRQGGATVGISKDGEVFVPTDKTVWLGCNKGGSAAYVMTVSGPSKNVKAAL